MGVVYMPETLGDHAIFHAWRANRYYHAMALAAWTASEMLDLVGPEHEETARMRLLGLVDQLRAFNDAAAEPPPPEWPGGCEGKDAP